MKTMFSILVAALLSLSSSLVLAKEYTVGQKDKKFTEKTLTLNVGDAVRFENQDPFFHSIFSLSKLKTFNLGSFKKGKSKVVVFDKVGTVEVECAIHPNMFLTVNVK